MPLHELDASAGAFFTPYIQTQRIDIRKRTDIPMLFLFLEPLEKKDAF